MNAQKKIEIQLPSNQEELKVEVYVRFGNPKYDDCRNFGICKMSESHLPNAIAKQRRKSSNAILVFEEKSLKIYFEKSSMNVETRSVFFGKKYFVIETEKLIPNIITQKINHTDLSIPKGNYIIKKKKGYFFIDIPL